MSVSQSNAFLKTVIMFLKVHVNQMIERMSHFGHFTTFHSFLSLLWLFIGPR